MPLIAPPAFPFKRFKDVSFASDCFQLLVQPIAVVPETLTISIGECNDG